MQEDNLDKWLASSLRKAQEESQVPYQEGAWEAFEKKRNPAKPMALTYWISGIAASLLLLIGFGLVQLTQSPEEENTSILAQSELPGVSEKFEDASSIDQTLSLAETKGLESLDSKNSSENKLGSSPSLASTPSNLKTNSGGKINSMGSNKQSSSENRTELPNSSKSTLAAITSEEESKKESDSLKVPSNSSATDAENQAKLEDLKKQIADLTGDEKEEVVSNQSQMALAVGINPGFGAGTQNNKNVTGSSLGMGVQMSLDLSEKVSVGSGMGVNFYSQTSEGSGMVAFANAAYPTNERTEIEQVQVDLPLYITYPLTRNKAISLQAGFSNILAFHQTAQQETMYVRQITVQDASSNLNSVSFRNESVSGFSSLEAPNTRFLPFATANLGVNIRVMESKKTSYLLMPFYNYPIQDISGTGNNIGFFGASLKVNFGTLPKK